MQHADTAFRFWIAASVFCILHSALLACASAPARAPVCRPDPLLQLRADIAASTQRPGVTRGSWGVVVDSLDRRDRLFELNSKTLFVPASVAKLVSVATAADAVGWDYRFETTLVATGSVSQGILSGDLIVVGSGDPSLGGRGGDDLSTLIAAVKDAGIVRIEGRIIGDDNALEEPRPQLSWAWDDLGYTTGALFGALNLAENRTVAFVVPGPGPGEPATVTLEARAVGRPIINRVVTTEAGTTSFVWPEQRPGEAALTIAGTIAAGGQAIPLAISTGNPTLWFVTAFRNRLIDEGITVSGEAADVDDLGASAMPTHPTPLFKYQSPTIAEISRPLLKDSINLYGEALMRLNAGRRQFPTNDAALEGLRQRLTSWGIPEGSYQLVDGSGLSRRDAISPEAIVVVLQRMFDPSGSSPFVNALPIAGVDGSLAARMKGTAAAGNVRAKTGTMSNIRSLAGYVTTRDGERLAFAIMVNNFEGTGADANAAIDAIAVRLAEFTRR